MPVRTDDRKVADSAVQFAHDRAQKITSARVIVTCPARNFVTLKIETDEGIYGIGDATLNGRKMAVVAYLEEHVIPCILGMDPGKIEDIWQFLYRGAYWRKGPVTMRAIAAVDVALWDIKACFQGCATNTVSTTICCMTGIIATPRKKLRCWANCLSLSDSSDLRM